MDDRDWLRDLIEYGNDALSIAAEWDALPEDEQHIKGLALERILEIMSTAGHSLTDRTRDRIDHNWRGLSDMRNIIAHQYHRLVIDELLKAVRTHFPGLVHEAGLLLGDP